MGAEWLERARDNGVARDRASRRRGEIRREREEMRSPKRCGFNRLPGSNFDIMKFVFYNSVN